MVPTYYNGLQQSRLGFEATRRTPSGDIFIRLETDFNGSQGFQIRHAYGQFQDFIVGQTWSLFSQIRSLPPMVDLDGPIGSSALRTPQMRWTPEALAAEFLPERTRASIALEFPQHNFTVVDSQQVTPVQFLPDPTFRIERPYEWGLVQLSAVIPILAGRLNAGGDLAFRIGWGVLAAGTYNINAKDRILAQGAIGQSIATFFGPFQERGLDLISSLDGQLNYQPLTVSGFVTYQHDWEPWLTSNLSAGFLTLESRAWVSPRQYQWGYGVYANAFWTVVEGARIGTEISVAERIDVSGERGLGTRGAALFYYDF